MPDNTVIDRALSVRQVARRWCVSPRKIRMMIRRGIIQAIDVGFGRRQLRITPEAILECEQSLTVKPKAPRRRHQRIDPEIERLLTQ